MSRRIADASAKVAIILPPAPETDHVLSASFGRLAKLSARFASSSETDALQGSYLQTYANALTPSFRMRWENRRARPFDPRLPTACDGGLVLRKKPTVVFDH
jgi:hypothetical protein